MYQALGVEYVPTQWNGSPVTADKLAAKIPAGAQYFLGFNEPNFKSQANMMPSQAAAAWPALQEVARRQGLKLVAPSVNYCGDGYLDDLPGRQARARYLRMYATHGGTTYGYSLYEVEAFGPAAALGTAPTATALAGASLYPNPATGVVTVQWPATATGLGCWLLTNATGQVVRTGHLLEQAGPNKLTIASQLLPAGSYVLTLEGTTR